MESKKPQKTTFDVLQDIQSRLKAPKNQRNSFGGYNYRSCEDILTALKPLLAEHHSTIVFADTLYELAGRVYVRTEVTLYTPYGEISTNAFAREQAVKKGYDEAQITGATSSYARKYALNALFAIDDTRDPDTQDNRNEGALPSKLVARISNAQTVDELGVIWSESATYQADATFKALMSQRKHELQDAQAL